jgi:hypothetical protein
MSGLLLAALLSRWIVVARRAEVGGAHTADDMLDHVDVALAPIDMHFAAFFPSLLLRLAEHANCAARTVPGDPYGRARTGTVSRTSCG